MPKKKPAKRHLAPTEITVPERVRKKVMPLFERKAALIAEARQVDGQISQYLNGWTDGIGVDTVKDNWSFADDLTKLVKMPKPKAVVPKRAISRKR